LVSHSFPTRRSSDLVRFGIGATAVLTLIALGIPPYFLFAIPAGAWTAIAFFRSSKTYVQIVGDELHFVRGKKIRALKLVKLVKLRADLGRAGGKGEREGVGSLSIQNQAGDSLTIPRIVNCVSLVEAIKTVSGPVIEPKPSVTEPKAPVVEPKPSVTEPKAPVVEPKA